MATQLRYLSGSDRIGSPLVIRVRSANITGTSPVAFHNLKCDVSVALQTPAGDPIPSDLAVTTITLSRPVGMGEEVDIDISSALRSVADRYQYSPAILTAPYVTAMPAPVSGASAPDYKPAISVYDEYMQDGILHTTRDSAVTLATLPLNDAGTTRMYPGSYTDLERLLAPRDQNGEAWLGLNTSNPRPLSAFTRKPSTPDDPELVPLGCTHIYPSSIGSSTAVTPAVPGLQYAVNGTLTATVPEASASGLTSRPFYAFTPRPLERFLTIRFINGLGLMETVHVRTGRKQQQHMQSQQHLRALMESFGSPGRSYYTKSHLRQEWQLSTGPITEPWLHWYAHDFLLTPAAWISLSDLHRAVFGSTSVRPNLGGSTPSDLWVPVHIKPDDTLDLLSTHETETLPEFLFTIQFDLDGPVLI